MKLQFNSFPHLCLAADQTLYLNNVSLYKIILLIFMFDLFLKFVPLC